MIVPFQHYPSLTSETYSLWLCNLDMLVSAGDSLQAGNSPSVTVGAQARALMNGRFDYFSAAIGGTDCVDALANYPLYNAPFYNAVRRTNVVTLGCGVNSYIHGRTRAQTFADILAFVTAAKATGFTVVVQTIQSHALIDAADVTWRTDINADILANAVAEGYTVWDVAANANLGCNGCHANTTYFQGDGVHFNATGVAIQAGLLKTVLEGLGL